MAKRSKLNNLLIIALVLVSVMALVILVGIFLPKPQEVLQGQVNPSGKLPYVVPYREEDLPHVDWEATDQYYEYYHGYTRLEKNGVKPLVPYGYGLSYTSFGRQRPVWT